ncbi:MAG: hypothetical protein MN733_08235 [Nitrososphaera sp.]|nr:hypothetical protein [Nitrososphaera sp.]
MKLLLTGPIEGKIQEFYRLAKPANPDWVVCGGDYGVWPDPAKMDRAARKHAGRDFSKMYVGVDPVGAAYQTLIISGTHDDNSWLKARHDAGNTEILANVHWLAQGYRTTIGYEKPLRVSGLGKAYSDATYNNKFNFRSSRHYTRSEVERACGSGPTDLLTIYEHLDAPGIRNIIFATRPKLILNVAHPSRKRYSEVQDTPVVQLARHEVKLIEWDEETRKFNVWP